MAWQWHQLDHMQIICISVYTDIHHNVAWAEAYLRTKWSLDPSSRLATKHKHYRQTDRQTDRQDNRPIAFAHKLSVYVYLSYQLHCAGGEKSCQLPVKNLPLFSSS